MWIAFKNNWQALAIKAQRIAMDKTIDS